MGSMNSGHKPLWMLTCYRSSGGIFVFYFQSVENFRWINHIVGLLPLHFDTEDSSLGNQLPVEVFCQISSVSQTHGPSVISPCSRQSGCRRSPEFSQTSQNKSSWCTLHLRILAFHCFWSFCAFSFIFANLAKHLKIFLTFIYIFRNLIL